MEENKNKMQIVLTNEEGEYSEIGSSGMIIEDSVSMEDINLVLDKDTRVLYLNPDGALVFDHTVLSSSAPENNPLILEPNTSYMLSTALQGNVVLSSNNLPSVGSAPKQLSFTTNQINEEGTKLCHLTTDYSQQTVTMVIDRSQSLGSEYIVLEPSSFMPSGSQTLTLDVDKGSQGLYSSIDVSKLNQCNTPSCTTIHHKPNTKISAYPIQLQQVTESTTGCMTLHCSSQQILSPGADASSLNLDSSQISKADLSEPDAHSGEDGCILEKQKNELRSLEQSHLEHHIKQIQKRNFGSLTSTEGDSGDDDSHEIEIIEELERAGIDDDTPIFSSISARLNSTILKLVPGCQQFLLEQAKQDTTVPPDIIFDSNMDCTFSGDLNAFLKLHNSLKRMIKLRSTSLLDFRCEKYGKSKDDKSLNCELLKPYVSSRGRQPKCSLKASQMGFVTSLDNYLNIDGMLTSNESKKVGGRGRKNICGNRRKRGRPRKVINSSVSKVKMSFETHQNNHEPDYASSANDVHGECLNELECVEPIEGHSVNISQQENQQTKEINFESTAGPQLGKPELDSSDPVCQRLFEEQTKYKKGLLNNILHKIGEQQSIENELPVHDLKTLSMDNDGCKEVAQENSSEPKVSNTIIKRRGRPCKKYDPHLPVEKVQPRNPLTESLATKQQRNYEEHLAFKFFCTQCSFKTKRQSHFLSHMRCHKDGTERKHSCTQCEFVTLSVPMLKRHELKHKQNLFSCNLCGAYTTDRNELLRRHIKLKHSLERSSGDRLNCPNCPFTCFKPKEMARHQVAHDRFSQISDADPNSCPHCKKSFRSRMHLHRHIRDVHGPEIRPHLCDTCGKAFKRTDALQQHKLVHVSRQARSLPFKCQTCDKGFRSPAHLKEHMSMHSSERPFLCQYCGAAFKTQPVQRKHIMTLHLQPRTHVCRTCCRQFNTKYALQRHESTHKTEPATAAAILIIENEDVLGEKVNTIEDKTAAKGTLETDSEALTTCEAPSIIVDDQESSCLVQDIIGSATTVIEEPLDQSGQGLQRAYIQGSQDGTLYYFTGELSTI